MDASGGHQQHLLGLKGKYVIRGGARSNMTTDWHVLLYMYTLTRGLAVFMYCSDEVDQTNVDVFCTSIGRTMGHVRWVSRGKGSWSHSLSPCPPQAPL